MTTDDRMCILRWFVDISGQRLPSQILIIVLSLKSIDFNRRQLTMPFPSRSQTLPVQPKNPFLSPEERAQHRRVSLQPRGRQPRRLSTSCGSPLPQPQHQDDDDDSPSEKDADSDNSDSDTDSISDANREPNSHTTDPEQALDHPPQLEPTDRHPHRRRPVPFRQRMKHFTWAWYTLSMSTGGLSVLIYNQPRQFWGLRHIGIALYILNLFFFFLVTAGLVTRFGLHRGTFTASITHQRESFFVPTLLLSIATLITSTERYVVSATSIVDLRAVEGSFWAYLAVSIAVAVAQYAFVFSRHRMRPFRSIMPTWILPIFPVMLTGTIASVIADTQPDIAAVPIIVAGLTCQGLGLSVAGMMYALLVGRLFFAGLPGREHRPGLFMCVGPPAFTALALVGMGNGLPDGSAVNADGTTDVLVLRMLAVVSAVFLWALSFWWFGIAAMAVIMRPPRYFHLGWWASVFPNSGFTLATIALGKAMDSQAIKDVATGMTALVALAWVVVLGFQVRAVWVGDIMYPGRDEDRDDSRK
ncbi:malic acid transport protein [Coniochaeta sp. 2T2.1]|nr:malic acid transport protein [Coniochaeta sp. 2T2.1]